MKQRWLIYYASAWSTSYAVAAVRVAYRRGDRVRVVLDCGERRWTLPNYLFETSREAHRAALPEWCRAGI